MFTPGTGIRICLSKLILIIPRGFPLSGGLGSVDIEAVAPRFSAWGVGVAGRVLERSGEGVCVW